MLKAPTKGFTSIIIPISFYFILDFFQFALIKYQNFKNSEEGGFLYA